ncbi:hypothetical protein GCM10011312_15660 [Planktosalinus lacus]|uniref:HYR domain-containing protein n=2 Tax=Planktosalinus lacus TaxID=1526573 RepID=A0A8J2VAN2_9FLAO|nr:hypothetical protein GCM10011312_15660 [Planktosalinus lacus]
MHLAAQIPGNALHFDGGSNSVTAGLPAVFDNIPSNDLTVEAQIRYTGTGFTRVFYAQKDQNNFFNISVTNFSGQMELYVYVGDAGTTHSVRTTSGLTVGENHHIAARWTALSNTLEIFVDGVLAGASFGGDTSTGVNEVMSIGSRTDGGQTFQGEIDELAVWSEARLLCLLVQDANEGITPTETNLVAYYEFNQGVPAGNNPGETTLVDATGSFPGSLQNFALSGTTSNWVGSQAFDDVIIAPDTQPTALCKPPFTLQLDANGEASISLSDIDDGSFDPCGVASITIDKTEFSCADIGDNTVTLTITAANGNTATCSTVVTVEDAVPPVAQCVAPFTIQLDANGQASLAVADIDAGSTDNCGIASMSINQTTFDCSDVGANTITLTVTDLYGNIATCTTTVTVEDTLPPIAVCVAPFTVQLDVNGQATITPEQVDGGSTASCGAVTLSLDTTDFSCADIGENTVTLTVTDENGNTDTCTTIVTVEDTVAPQAVCVAPFTIQLDTNGAASITPADIDGGSTDACGIASMTISQSIFDCTHVGDNTITLTVTDVNGNESTCTTVVTVEDTIPPVATCVAPFTIQLDANGQASITAEDIDNGSTDNCAIASMTISQSTFDCTDVGANTITLTVTDVNGNVSTCTTVVTVEDALPPTALCVAPFTIQLDVNGQASITAADIDAGSSDSCGVASLSISQSTFDCSDVGDNTITLTVTDENGLESTCTTVVTVEDNVAPEAVCVAPFTIQLDANGVASITAADIDAGSTDACGIASLSLSQTDFDCNDVGDNTITLTVTDVNGNESTCTTMVTVEDTIPPVATCVAPFTIQLDANGQASITAEDIDNGSTDNCAIASMTISQSTFDCTDVGANTITLIVTDTSGNTASCTTTVTVEDTLAPVAVCVAPFTVQLDENGQASITPEQVDGGSTASCGAVTLSIDTTDFSCADIGEQLVTLTVTDENGNTDSCTTTVTVEDSIAPTAVCVAPFTIQLDAGGAAGITAADIDGGSTDNCGIASMTLSQSNFDCADVGDNTITLTVTDVNGNVSTCTTVVTVEDTFPPQALCAAPFTIQLDANGQASITAEDIDNGSTDTCGMASMTISPSTFDCSDVGDNTITLTVTDTGGNTTTCTTTVTVENTLPPVAQCVAPFTVQLDENGQASITPEQVDGGSTASCGAVTLALDTTSFSCADIGEHVVTLTVTDENGNTDSCTTTVTVEDSIAPTAMCVAPFTIQLDANGEASITVSDINAGSTDNCSFASISISQTTFNCADVGDNIITLTLTDISGTTSTCTTVVTVEDTTPPTVVCAEPFTVQLDSNGQATLTAAMLDDGSFDECGIASMSLSPSQFDCTDLGENTVTLTVTDLNGNSASCTTVVTVEASAEPIAACVAPFTVELDANGLATITAADIDNGSAAFCSGVTLAINVTQFSCADIGENTVTLTVTDDFGNTAACSTTVTVADTTAPQAFCVAPFTLALDENGEATITPAMIDDGSFDNCDTASISISQTSFDCNDLGVQTVFLTITDNEGNSSQCSTEVTLVDDLAPQISCPEDFTVFTNENGTYIMEDFIDLGMVFAVDNCTDPVTSITQSPSPGTFVGLGQYEVSFTATDASGNESSCAFNLTVDEVLSTPDAYFGSLSLYPNPATVVSTLENPQLVQIDQITIYDLRGRMINKQHFNSPQAHYPLDISTLNASVYMLLIEGEGKQTIKKLIVR